MSLENSILNSEGENKNNKLTEEEKEAEAKKNIEFKLQKEKIWVEIEVEQEIFQLKEMVDSWMISWDIANKILSWEQITSEEIKEIFDKIDEIEDIKNIDDYLPRSLRITREEYIKAVKNDIFREKTITKLNTSLVLLSNKINPDSAIWLNLFSWFVNVLDKNLIRVQENTIDIKNWLRKIDQEKNLSKEDNRSFLQKIIDFIKELFN